MLHGFWRRAGLAAAGAGLAAAVLGITATAPIAAAAPYPAPSVSPSASGSASASASASASGGLAQAIGGNQLASHGLVVNYASRSAPSLPDIKASAFVVANAGTGQVLAARDPHGWYLPASTLKVLTAISLIPVLNPNATTVATKLAASTVPNVAGIIPGHAYKISDLFTALLTISANDAAIALTQAAGHGSFSQGMALINAEARHLQANDTVAVQPNGLDAPGQHTSAYDLALFARRALQLPAFLKYDETLSAKFPVTAHKSVTLYNQNSLLTNYPGAIGGKIGWTSAAGATYIGIAKRNGVTLIVTLLHCPALTEVDSAESLLNWGFSAEKKVTPVGTLVSPLAPAAPVPTPARTVAPKVKAPVRAALPARTAAATSGPSVLTAAGFSCVALIAVGLTFGFSRRRLAAGHRRPRRGEPGGRDAAGTRAAQGRPAEGRRPAGGMRPPEPRRPADGGRPAASGRAGAGRRPAGD